MNCVINYGHMGRTPYLESYIYQQVRKMANKFKRSRNIKFEVWVDNDNPRSSAGEPEYTCQVELKRDNHRPLFVKKADKDFFKSFQSAMTALRKRLKSDIKKPRTLRAQPSHFAEAE